jgi:hypothetical protein
MARLIREIALFVALLPWSTGAMAAEVLPATQPDPAQTLTRKITELEARIAQLQSRRSAVQADVDAAARQVLAEADAHDALMSTGSPTGGYDPRIGFIVQSDDANFTFSPGILLQFRDETAIRQRIPSGGGGAAGGSGSDVQNGFEIARARLIFDGNLFSPNLTYYLQIQDDFGADSFSLLDAYVLYRVSNQSPLALRAGQFKDALWHEENVNQAKQLAVERTLANALLGGGQTGHVQGVVLIYDQDALRGLLALHNGYDSADKPFFEGGGRGGEVGAGAGVTPTKFGFTTRAEYLAIGERTPQFNPFSEYDDFTALGNTQNILVLGTGADYSQSGGDDVLFHTVDAQYETTGGLALYGAYLGAYRHLNHFEGVNPGCYYDCGAIAQAAYLLSSSFEVFARYDYTHLDGHAIPGILNDNVHEITIGANYYFHGHQTKVTLDASWLPNGCPADVEGAGILQDDGHGELVIRAQFQLEV